MTGRIERLFPRYGFIKPEDGGVDYFFHISSVPEGQHIHEEDAVEFEVGERAEGSPRPVAVNVRLAKERA